MLDRLNNDIQNVSAKAASNELISRNNQAQIAKLQLESTDKNQNIVKKDGEARSQNPDVQEPKAWKNAPKVGWIIPKQLSCHCPINQFFELDYSRAVIEIMIIVNK